jgi:Fe-S cluster biogenesis protein NfuA
MSEVRQRVERMLAEVLAPLIRADHGELYLVEVQETYVSLHLGGRFSGCPGNTLVARRVIQPALARVLPNARVQVTSGFVVPEGAELLGTPQS